jgi:DNA-binding MarR family transcriptional regulator
MGKKAAPIAEGKVPDIGIGKLLRSSHIAFSRRLRSALNAQGITLGEFIHLDILWDEDGLNQKEISRRAGILSSSSTKTLELLEKRKFVLRERSDSDRRNQTVRLTAEGLRLKTKLLACAAEINVIARRGLTKSEVLTFFSLLEKIAGNLKQRKAESRANDLEFGE